MSITEKIIVHADLLHARDAIDVLLADALLLGGSKRGDTHERAFATGMTASYMKRARAALKDAMRDIEKGKGPVTQSELERITNRMARTVGNLSDEDKQFVRDKTADLYALARIDWIEQSSDAAKKLLRKAETPEIRTVFGYTFDMVDEQAVNAMANNQLYWIGPEHGKEIQAGILGKAETEIFNKGLGRKDAAAAFEQMARQELGIAKIPARYSGNAQSYFAGIAGLVRVQSSAFAATRSFREVGVTTYRINAVNDARTCKECGFMDGREFTIEQAESHISNLMGAKTPEAVKQVNPWLSIDQMLLATTTGKNPQVGLANAGTALPPYHFKCRCTVEPVSFSADIYEVDVPPIGELSPNMGFPYAENKMKSVPMQLDGMHAKAVYEAPDGSRWMFKPQPEWQSHVDKATADVAKALGIDAPDVYVVKFQGQMGSIQRLYDDVDGPMKAYKKKLTTAQAETLQREHAFDWLISNHDSHDRNLLMLKNGDIKGIDKGQAFKFLGKDKLSITYHPNPSPSYYNTVFDRYADGSNLAPLVDINKSKVMQNFFKAVEDMPDETFVAYFKEYITGAKKAGTLATGNEDEFIKLLLARKKNLRKDITEFYENLNSQRAKVIPPKARKPRKSKTAPVEEKAIDPLKDTNAYQIIDDDFINAVDDAGALGKSFYIGGDSFENMNMLAYKVSDDLVIETKIRETAGKALAKRLDEMALDVTGTQVADEAWPVFEKFVKHVNHHFGPNGDQVINKQYLKDAIQAAYKIPSKNKFMSDYYFNILDELWDPGSEKVIQKNIGKFYKPFPQPKSIPKSVPGEYKVIRTNTYDTDKKFIDGKIIGDVGKEGKEWSGRVTYQIKFDDGTRIDFVTQGDKNLTSRAGRIQIYPGSNNIESYKRALKHLDDLGLDSKLANVKDLELMYLQKATYANRLHTQPEFKKIINSKRMKVDDKIAGLKDLWGQRLGKPLTEEIGYQPFPYYSYKDNIGIGRWKRFDWDEDEFKRVKLTHNVTGTQFNNSDDFVEKFETMCKSRGLVSTEERMRTGIGVGNTMSPDEDMATGGASYVFTRLSYRFDPPNTLVFRNKALFDFDTISYDGDKYGNISQQHLKNRAKNFGEIKEYSMAGQNETIIKGSLSFDDLETVNLPGWVDANKISDILKKYGYDNVEVKGGIR